MKIVFFGSPASSIPSLLRLIEEGHQIALIITQPDKPSGRGKKLTQSPVKKIAIKKGIPVYQPERIKFDQIAKEKIQKIKPDLNIVVAYGQIIPLSILETPKHQSINVHFSLLPKYRGASPVQWTLLNGEKTTGITIFKLNEKMDEGDIFSKVETDIHPYENAGELEARLSTIGAELLVKTIANLKNIRTYKQNHSQATYAPKLKKEDGQIDWHKDAKYIDRHVRAFTPWPSAFSFFQGKRVIITMGKGIKEEVIHSANPGEILKIKKDGIEVCCGQGSVYLIESLRPENRKEMPAYSFSLGANIKPGDLLS
ncbi:MAG: methionyl-tRNA formyltransferase [Acidobacteriota bacterium]|nr:methionyl-tRNA formyltransferase [Acidobacteriota bacterium]